MEYYGKKLPSGFIYMFSKKDMKEIDELTGNCIDSVYLDGTSYSETKMSKSWARNKTATYISSSMDDENNLIVNIRLYGIRTANFENQEAFLVKKQSIKQELIDKISENINALQINNPITKHQFISIKTA